MAFPFFVHSDSHFSHPSLDALVLQALKLSKDFQRNPSVYALSDKDRERLSSVMHIADQLSRGEGGPPDIGIEGQNRLAGEGGNEGIGLTGEDEGGATSTKKRGSNNNDAKVPPVHFELRQPDGKTDLGATTGLYVRNTPMFRARLAAARGTDRQEMVGIWITNACFMCLRVS